MMVLALTIARISPFKTEVHRVISEDVTTDTVESKFSMKVWIRRTDHHSSRNG
jgi:hypothetical protein